LRGARVFCLAAVLAILYLISLTVRIYLAGKQDERGPADVIIVLGAAQWDGRPRPMYLGRLEHAIALYQQGYASTLLFCGGKRPGDRFTEAWAGKHYAEEHGVPSRAILMEAQGRTTMQSMQYAADIMRRQGLRTAMVVSDPFHAFRLRRIARDLGMSARVSPTPYSRAKSLRTQGEYIVREVGSYAIYRLFGM
jgi:uncharacterized SAM-binding protein YcdF (DUF218 family)